jgi:uncharacterized protein (TIGR03437 family)
MSGLYLTTGACQGWNPPNNLYAPTISYLSSNFTPAGSTTLIAIFGTNFKLYSTIKFGTFTPTMIFISSAQIDFYMPSSAFPGNYPVQVFNDTTPSNTVDYTVYESPGLWYQNPANSNIISNSNTGGLVVNGPIKINSNFVNLVNTNSGNLAFNDAYSVSNSQTISWPYTTSKITADLNGILITGDLTVSGIIFGTISPPSDYRIKDIIEPLNSSYTVDDLKPIKYYNKKSGKEEIGFIAHEVQEVFPCLVTGKKDGPDIQTLNYMGLIGILTKEIQNLKAEMAELKKSNK